MLGFAWIYYEAMQNDLAFMSAQENKNFAKILSPSLKVSDTMEIDRILSLASSGNHFIAVIDSNHDILLSDYSNLALVTPAKVGIQARYGRSRTTSVTNPAVP